MLTPVLTSHAECGRCVLLRGSPDERQAVQVTMYSTAACHAPFMGRRGSVALAGMAVLATLAGACDSEAKDSHTIANCDALLTYHGQTYYAVRPTCRSRAIKSVGARFLTVLMGWHLGPIRACSPWSTRSPGLVLIAL